MRTRNTAAHTFHRFDARRRHLQLTGQRAAAAAAKDDDVLAG